MLKIPLRRVTPEADLEYADQILWALVGAIRDRHGADHFDADEWTIRLACLQDDLGVQYRVSAYVDGRLAFVRQDHDLRENVTAFARSLFYGLLRGRWPALPVD